MKRLIECVPNFSEGREAAKVDAIVAAMSSVQGVYVLDREMDADHNRSVIHWRASRMPWPRRRCLALAKQRS